MTNETIALMHRHRSIRTFAPDPITRPTIETIVTAGQRAATSSNLQLYSAVVVMDAAKRAHLAELCGDQEQIRQAPVFIAWCADRSRLERACTQRGYTQNSDYVEALLVAAVDVGLVMQNATLAAESLGLGCCYIGAVRNNPQAVIELLELPPLVFPISGMTLGKPADDPMIRPRLATQAILHWEHYDASGEEPLLEAYDRAMSQTGIYAGRQVEVPGKPGEVEDYGWREHSARRVAHPRRVAMRDVLTHQGFGLQ
ncbi:MAG: NADPH-dependent oxidoreductase [Candidatus Tectomicrobia bacterium]|uniref:NADPH-dependent oxidoreductase n=1 Tax=Tectimicrobiota bacterium TaxID=2528274 RepID=A0A937W646_UNCTE|nr:NADPH-dependent oxidoreductase [Candidatus Tectomicrobia bacterium]